MVLNPPVCTRESHIQGFRNDWIEPSRHCAAFLPIPMDNNRIETLMSLLEELKQKQASPIIIQSILEAIEEAKSKQ